MRTTNAKYIMNYFCAVAFCLLALQVCPVNAQTPVVHPGQGLIVPDGEIVNQMSPFSFRVLIGIDRSFCCTITTSGSGAFINSVTGSGSSAQVPFTLRGNLHPAVLSGTSTATSARACLITTVSNAFLFSANFGGPNGGDTVGIVRADCEQTALFGGYNTSAASLNYLELTNATATDIAVRIVASNEFSPNTIAIDQSFTVSGGRRMDLPLHDMVPAGAFGSLIASHDGTIGSLTASVSQYRIVTPFPLEFQLVGRIPFEVFK